MYYIIYLINYFGKLIVYKIKYNIFIYLKIGDWGLGIGEWGLGVWGGGAKPQTPTPNPQSPAPKPQTPEV